MVKYVARTKLYKGRNLNQMEPSAVFGTYSTRSKAESAVDVLKSAGFSNTDISVLLPEDSGSQEFFIEEGSKASQGAAVGAGSGAALGGAMGWLIGIGALAIPGLGPVVGAGPLLAALAGTAMGGTLGGLTGALVGMGIPEHEATNYERDLRTGRVLVATHCETAEEINRARHIFSKTGAQNMATSLGTGWETERAA